jgi:hypothetical protein
LEVKVTQRKSSQAEVTDKEKEKEREQRIRIYAIESLIRSHHSRLQPEEIATQSEETDEEN